MKAPSRLAVAGLWILVTGCKASVSADAKVGGESDGLEEPLERPLAADQAEFVDSEGEEPLLGARQGLRYHGPATTHCRCVDVAMGQATDPAFEWSTERPRTNPNTQLVVAIANAEGACPGAPEGSSGASYWGFETQGNDVIVVVEPAVEGRPVASGAIIPKPFGDGQVYLRPVSSSLPYGKALEDGDRCKVGNPGAQRVATSSDKKQLSKGGNLRITAPPKDEDEDGDDDINE